MQESLTNSADTVKSAVEGQAGVVAVGYTFVSPGGSRSSSVLNSGSDNDNDNDSATEHGVAEPPSARQLRFRGLEASKRYVVSLCTESNSGTLSKVTVVEAEAHAEAPMVRLSDCCCPRANAIGISSALAGRFEGGTRPC